MQLLSLQFAGFFILVYAFALIMKAYPRKYLIIVFLASLLFLISFGWYATATIGGIAVGNFLLLKLLLAKNSRTYQRVVLILGVILNVATLLVFKEFSHLVDTFLDISTSLKFTVQMDIGQVLAPIGISFVVFRVISHLVDTYKNNVAPPNFIHYLTYVLFFPQLLSGPLMRAAPFYEQLAHPSETVYSTGEIFVFLFTGVVKKFLIASYLYSFATDPFTAPQGYNSLELILSAFAYGCMLYADFSGYSDLSRVLSLLLGIRPPVNFHSPYRAIGISDFWDRWHISLSTWLKDYVYIPLGGSRVGKFRKALNMIITMLVSGFWHGWGWQFGVWGLLHAIGSIVTHSIADVWAKIAPRVSKPVTAIFACLAWLLTINYVMFAWIFFASEDLPSAFSYIGSIFTQWNLPIQSITPLVIGLMALTLVGNFISDHFVKNVIEKISKVPIIGQAIFASLLIYIILKLGPELVSPFIYFSF